MKSIKTLAFVFILSSSWLNSKAQTKEETEKWIEEKINTLSTSKTYSYDLGYVDGERSIVSYVLTPLNFAIREGKITISYSSTLKQYEKKKWVTYYTDKKNLSTKINSLDTIAPAIYSNSKDLITGKETLHYGDNYLTIQLKCSCLEGLSRLEGRESLYLFPILVDKNAEPDLLNRLNKAFARLNSFYPKPKETF